MHYVRTHLVVDDRVIDGEDSWPVIEPIWWSAEIHYGERRYEESLRPFSREQRWLLAINWYKAEVDNGGHDQFFANPTGIVWRDALTGLREIGLGQGVEILQASTVRMGRFPALESEERKRILTTLRPDFSDLDARFYAVMDGNVVNAKMVDFIRSRRNSFYFDGRVNVGVS